MPEMMSRTSVWAPNPRARPTTPAPASSGRMSTSQGRQHREDGDSEHGCLERHAQGRQQGGEARGALAGIVAHGLHARVLGVQPAVDREPG